MDWVTAVILALAIVTAASIIAWAAAPKGWRTIVANAVAGAFVVAAPMIDAVLDYLVGVPLHELFDQKTAIALSLAIGLMNAVWRKFTTTPIGKPR